MQLAIFLILVPLLPAALNALARNRKMRTVATFAGAAAIIAASVAFGAMRFANGADALDFDGEVVSWLLFAVDLVLCGVVLFQAFRHKRPLALALGVVQLVVVFLIEFMAAPGSSSTGHALYADALSAIMALVIGIVGCLICIYAVGYMRDFSKHHEGDAVPPSDRVPDRQNMFFALMFAFLSAMFLIVFSDNLAWLFTGWEATTVCSFLLIGYTRTPEAIDNAFRQIVFNMLGGIAFGVAVVVSGAVFGEMTLSGFVLNAQGSAGAQVAQAMTIPVLLMAFSGLVKAAQMPFQTWLLGAMVAPTPTSALLHSSTMVKAGIFILIKLSPCLGGVSPTGAGANGAGIMVILVGAITFLVAACMAVAETNAKRVLAFSTISNLGLMALCAGLGTAEGVWAAVFLLVFHAIVKAMLFMCVGTAEHHIGSRDIECMDDLAVRMPHLSRLMGAGMLGMCVAPFGMLVSKWAAIVSTADVGLMAVLVILAFGSAPTFFFWAKWIGKVSAVGPAADNVERSVHKCEWAVCYSCIALSIAMCFALPAASACVVAPYATGLATGDALGGGIDEGSFAIISVILGLMIVAYLAMFRHTKRGEDTPYLAGAGIDMDRRTFAGAAGTVVRASSRNWQLSSWFGEKALSGMGNAAVLAVMAASLIMSALSTISAAGWFA